MTFHKVTDPKPKTRICATCHQRIIGIIDRTGLTVWLSDTALSPSLEAIHVIANIPTYWVRPRRDGSAWLDWRNPKTTARDLIAIVTSASPDPGQLVLSQHPHRTPGPSATPPTWLTPPRPSTATTDPEGIPF